MRDPKTRENTATDAPVANFISSLKTPNLDINQVYILLVLSRRVFYYFAASSWESFPSFKNKVLRICNTCAVSAYGNSKRIGVMHVRHSMSSLPSFISVAKPVVPSLHQLGASELSANCRDIRVLVAIDHFLFRTSLRALLDASSRCQVVADAGDLKTTLQMTDEYRPDILLLGWQMSQQDDMRILRELAVCPYSLRVILVGVEQKSAAVVRAIQLGVRGILSNETGCDELFDAIRKVMDGQHVLGQAAVDSLVHIATNPAPRTAFQKAKQKFGITRREFDVISEVVAGFSTVEIVERLSLSPNTLKHHMTHIYDKLGLSNRLELVLFAVHHGIVSEAH